VAPDRTGFGNDELVLTYSGTLYGPRDPTTLVQAAEQLTDEGHPSIEALRFQFLGRVADRFRSMMTEGRTSSCFRLAGYLEHSDALSRSKGSDALLLIVDQVPQSAAILTGKLFEYLGLGKPLVALTPPGEAADLVRGLGAGAVVQPGDPQGMREALVSLWTRWKAGELTGAAPEAVAGFTREHQTAELAVIFDELARQGLARPGR
jgi:glycosyltransferase involved in cell wall biosynthesis